MVELNSTSGLKQLRESLAGLRSRMRKLDSLDVEQIATALAEFQLAVAKHKRRLREEGHYVSAAQLQILQSERDSSRLSLMSATSFETWHREPADLGTEERSSRAVAANVPGSVPNVADDAAAATGALREHEHEPDGHELGPCLSEDPPQRRGDARPVARTAS